MFPPHPKAGPPKHGTQKGGKAKPSPGGPNPHGKGHPLPPSGGAHSAAKAKKVKPGGDPLVGLKNALKAGQVLSLSQKVAEQGG